MLAGAAAVNGNTDAVVPESDFLELPQGAGSPAAKVVQEKSTLVQTKTTSKFGPLFGGKGWILGDYGEDYGYGDHHADHHDDHHGHGSGAGSAFDDHHHHFDAEAEIPVAQQPATALFQDLSVDGHVYKN